MFGKLIAAGLGAAAGYAYAKYRMNEAADDEAVDIDHCDLEDEGEAIDADDAEDDPVIDGFGADSVDNDE